MCVETLKNAFQQTLASILGVFALWSVHSGKGLMLAQVEDDALHCGFRGHLRRFAFSPFASGEERTQNSTTYILELSTCYEKNVKKCNS